VTRIVVFGDEVGERLKDATAIVRRAWRAGERTGPERMPASSEMLFTLLPAALRDAVLAHFAEIRRARNGFDHPVLRRPRVPR
jgi:hypothetical protein